MEAMGDGSTGSGLSLFRRAQKNRLVTVAALAALLLSNASGTYRVSAAATLPADTITPPATTCDTGSATAPVDGTTPTDPAPQTQSVNQPTSRTAGRAAAIPDYQAVVRPGETKAHTVAYDGAKLSIRPGAVTLPTGIGITPLTKTELPKLDSGMTNVTARPRSGYRFTPHPQTFAEDITVALPYDPALLDPDFTAQDIYTYFYNDVDLCWQPLERVSVDEVTHVVTSLTDHFTDMINATVMVPEHPEGASFDPNQIKGIQAGDPGSGVNLIAPPASNNQGDNHLSYPIEVPAGRAGLQPDLRIDYTSSAGNGWMGVGWDLPLKAIVIDTRWGVPRYSADQETESYAINGEELTPVAHRGPLQARSAEKVFHTRTEGGFARIVRHGDGPANYTWEVTDKSGTRWLYGAAAGDTGPAAEATLTDRNSNVYLWALREVRDANGNVMRYDYAGVDDPGIAGGSEPGHNIYLKRITYTGRDDVDGRYAVTFTRDRELGEPLRVDTMVDARGGFKRVTADLLRRVDVTLDDNLIRRYEFGYTTGAFFKTLLKSVSQFDDKGELFNTHQFSYYDDIRDGQGQYQAFDQVDWTSPGDNLSKDALNLTSERAGDASAINANTSTGAGGHLYVGVGTSPTKTNSAGVKVGFNHADDEGLLALVDVDGDSLPDKVFRAGGQTRFRKNLARPGGVPQFSDTATPLNLPGIAGESSNSTTVGVEAYPGAVAAQLDFVNTFSTTDQYFTDVNGDGISDLVNGSTVLFGRIGADGVPVYGVSGDTQVPVRQGPVATDNLFGDFAADRDRLVDSFPLLDSVRRWVAPFDGTVRVEGDVALSPDTATARATSTSADGVRVAIQREDAELWSEQIGPKDNTAHTPSGVDSVAVTKGQRLYFRVQSVFDGSLDDVSWDPKVTYVGQPDSTDVNGLPVFQYQASRDFTLGGRAATVKVPLTGTMHLTGDLVKRAATTDDVAVVITRDGTPVLEQTLAAGTTGTIPVDLDVPVQQGQTLAWRIRVDSPIDVARVEWTPQAFYTVADGVDRVTDSNGDPLITVDPPYALDLYPVDGLDAPQGSLAITQDGQLTASPQLDFAFGDAHPTARVAFTVKRRGGLLAKSFFDIQNGTVTAPDPVTVDVTSGDEVFFDFSTTDPALRGFLTSQSVQVSGAAGPQAAPSAFHSAAEEGAFAQPYRGWAAIGYNGNRGRATEPIRQGDLVVDEHFGDGLPTSVDPQGQRDQFAADPRVPVPNAVPFTPAPRRARWESGDNSWVAAADTSSSRLGAPSVDLPSPDDLADATAVPRLSRSDQISLTGGVGGPVGNLGGSIATGNSTGEVDFLDMNGDQFPDVVGSGGIQYTDMNGGLGSTRGSIPDGAVRRTSNVAGNASAGSAARTISTGRGYSSPPGHVPANDGEAGNDMPPFGVGANLGGSSSETNFDLSDINGDALPDRVYADGRVALNLGYRFGAAEQWRNPAPINDGSGANAGLNIGFNTDFYGFAGGASYNEASSSTASTLQDVNGDDLVDRVFAGNPIRVALNTGNGFEPPVPFNGSLSGINSDQNASLGGGAYFTFGICFVAVCVVINPGADVTTGASRSEQALRDINGDGFADQLASTKDNQLTVAENRTGRTNLLRSVSRPLGGRMDFDYTRDGNTVDQPQSRWVLTRVAVNDGHPGDGQDVHLTTYEYQKGHFDRLEREFDGYATVTERHRDPATGDAVYRSVTREFRTDGHYTRGLLTRELTTDAAGRPFVETANTYALRDVTTGAAADAASTTATVFPQLVRTDKRFYEGQATPGKATFTTMEYDELGNLTRSLDAGDTGAADDVDSRISYSTDDPACQSTHIVGAATQFEVLGGGTVLRHREATVDCATGNITQIRARLAGGDTAVTDMTYRDDGNLSSVTSPPNEKGQRYKLDYTYDDQVGIYPASITDSFGYRSLSTYDLRFGQEETTTDFNGQVVRNTYDSVGRLDTVTGPYEAPENRVTIDFEYHPQAPVPYAVTRHVDRQADNTVGQDTIDTVTFADGLGRVIQSKRDATIHTGPDSPPQDAVVVSGRMVFDFVGRPVEQFYPVTEPKGPANTTFNDSVDTVAPTRMTYDILDRATRTVIPDNTATQISYGFGPDRAGTTQFETVTTDANGNAKRTYKDVRQLTTAVKEFNPAGGQPVIWTSYAYDPLGELTAATDDHNNVTTSAYDNFGRRTSMSSPDAGRTDTVYDLADNPIRKITAKLAAEGKAISYDYDFNRLAAIRYPVFTANNVTYTYGDPGAPGGGADRVIHQTDGAGTLDRQYGPLGEVVRETRTTPTQGSHIETLTTEYRYDTFNRMLGMTFPDGEQLSYEYNSGGQVDAATGVKGGTTYRYLKRLDYDKFDQRVQLDTGNGTRTTYTYNAQDRRLQNLRASIEQGYVFENLNYTYDDVGNVTAVQNDTLPPDGPGVGVQVGGPSTQTFQYDDLYQLTHAEGTYQPRGPKANRYSVDLTYDSIHNITGKNQVNELVGNGSTQLQGKTSYNYTYSYGGSKPHAPSTIGPFTLAYDANGNQVSRDQQPRPRRQMIWDEEDRLACSHENVQSQTLPQTPASCDNAGGTPNDARYAYDDQGNRVVKDSAQFNVYPNQNFSTRGNQQFKHIYVGSQKLLTKFVEPPQRVEDRQYYAHSDQLGSTGFVTDADGGLSENTMYFPGGETWVSEHPSQPVPQQFTGKEFDPETNLYYFGDRYYDPRTQVWQSTDPELGSYLDGGPNGGVYSSTNLSLYTYGNNNPTTFVDPDGRVSWGDFAWGVAKGAAVGVVAGVAVGALIASGGTLAPAIGYAIVAYGTVATAVTVGEVATGQDLAGNRLTDAQRSERAGELVGGLAAGGVGARFGSRLMTRFRASRAVTPPETPAANPEGPPATPATPEVAPQTPAQAPAPAPEYVRMRPGFEPTPNRGGAPGSRPGEDFTPAGRDEVLQRNAASHPDGIARCTICDTRLTVPAKSQRGVTPPRTDAQVDHRLAKSRGGSGDPSNGDGLCRACNRIKSDGDP